MNRYDQYYPRPLLKRDSFFSLNGQWKLNGREICVPFPPESEASGYHGDTDRLLYEKSFMLPEDFYSTGDKVLLHFGAVDQICDVYLNDHFVIHHEGGYLPFAADISAYLKKENELRVEATDTLDPFYPFGKQCKKPKGMWYTPVSGIWQSVWIEAYPQDGIDALQIETDMHELHLHITSQAKRFTVEFDGFRQTYDYNDIRILIPKPHLWSLSDPYLYDLKITTGNDCITSYFGLKEISVRNIGAYPRLYLNEEPLFLNGLLDQGYFQTGIYTPEDPKEYEKDILNIKALGFNCLRKHIKVEAEAFYHYCDRHGILVMQDMVNSGTYSFFRDTILPTIGLTHISCPIKDQKRYDFFLSHCQETIGLLKSHPSVIAYTIYNEGWGQQAASEAYDVLKTLDPQRLFDATSGWFFDDHSDFDSWHIYFRNKVLKGKDRPLLLSECGGFIRDVSGSKGKVWGYGKAGSREELMQKIEEMHRQMYIPSIQNGLCGAIMTQISDVENEINGIFSYDRSICKVDPMRLAEDNRRLQEIYQETCRENE